MITQLTIALIDGGLVDGLEEFSVEEETTSGVGSWYQLSLLWEYG